MSSPDRRLEITQLAFATWGMFVAFVVHDGEEWLTMPGWGSRNVDRLRRLYPRVPPRFWRRLDLPAVHVRAGITVMGLVFLLAAALGARTDARSIVYQVILIGFGVHGLGHLGQALLARGYAPGLITSVLVVLPFSTWAWLVVEASGAVTAHVGVLVSVGVLLITPVIIGVHLAVFAGRRLASRVRQR
jgi:Protein of unknown function with HXXEE motif